MSIRRGVCLWFKVARIVDDETTVGCAYFRRAAWASVFALFAVSIVTFSGQANAVVSAPGAPTALQSFPALDGVGLRWTGDYLGAWPTSYTIYSRPDSESPWHSLATVTASQTTAQASYVDSTIANGASADYAVTDSNAGGESPMSDDLTLDRPATDPQTGSIDAVTADADPEGYLVNEHLDSSTGASVTVDPDGSMSATQSSNFVLLSLPVVPGPGSYPIGDASSATPIPLNLSTSGNGCDIETGTLTVAAAAYDSNLKPVLFTASYAFSCDSQPMTYGVIRWNSTAGYRDVVATPSSVGPIETATGAQSDEQMVTVTGYGPTDTDLGSAAISSDASIDWTISSDSCSSTVLAAGSSCQVGVTFSPSAAGDRTAVLTIPDDTDRGSHVVALTGTGVVPPGFVAAQVRVALNRAQISWVPPTDDGGADVTQYQLFRWTTDPATQQLIDTVVPTNQVLGGTYDDLGLAAGTTYNYGVIATNLAGSSSESQVIVTIPHDEFLMDGSEAVALRGAPPIDISTTAAVHSHVAVVPGDKQIVYAGGFNPSSIDIVVANADGSGTPRRLTTMGGTDPAVSMDGRTVAFVHVSPATQVPSIWTVPLAGGTPVERAIGYDNPSWLPNGQTVVAEPSPIFEEPSNGDLVDIAADGAITTIPGTTNGHQPAVSPDGHWIAYEVIDPSTGSYSLAVVPVGGGVAQATAAQPTAINDISWRTDGTRIFADNSTILLADFNPATGQPDGFSTVAPQENGGAPLYTAYLNGDAVALAAAPGFTGSEPTATIVAPAGATNTCSLDGATATACADTWTPSTTLSEGPHLLTVSSTPLSGVASSVTWAFTVDTIAPTLKVLAPTSRTTTDPTVVVRYGGTDAGGVASYDVRMRVASSGKGYGTYTYPAEWQQTADTDEGVAASPGHEYCFSVRVHDFAGHVSPWSTDRCTAVPLDDRALLASSAWTHRKGTAYLHGTVTTSDRKGQTLTLADVNARQVVVYATTCRRCGKATVTIGHTVIGHLKLRSDSLHRSVPLTLPKLAARRTGTLRITVATNKKLVAIDAVTVLHE
jgi:hypothetical protein